MNSLSNPVSLNLDPAMVSALRDFEAGDPSQQDALIANHLDKARRDLQRNFKLFINGKEYSQAAHDILPFSWKRTALKVCAVLLCCTVLLAYFGMQLWKHVAGIEKEMRGAKPFREAELAKQHLEQLGISKQNIFSLLCQTNQNLFADLLQVTPEQYGYLESPSLPPGHRIGVRILQNSATIHRLYVHVANQVPTLQATARVQIAAGEMPEAPPNPVFPSKVLWDKNVTLTFNAASKSLTMAVG